jgi:hypothetical protein
LRTFHRLLFFPTRKIETLFIICLYILHFSKTLLKRIIIDAQSLIEIKEIHINEIRDDISKQLLTPRLEHFGLTAVVYESIRSIVASFFDLSILNQCLTIVLVTCSLYLYMQVLNLIDETNMIILLKYIIYFCEVVARRIHFIEFQR